MRISILLEPAMPSRFFNAEIKKLFLPFPQIELVFQDVADILRNGVRGEVFLNSHGEIYPYVIEDVLYEYFSNGGGLFHLGGSPFETAVIEQDGEWVPVVRTFGDSRDNAGFGPLDKEFDYFRAKLGLTVYTPPDLDDAADSLKIVFQSKLCSCGELPLTVPPKGLDIAATAQLRLFQPQLDLMDHRAYMARPIVRETIHTASVVSPVGKKLANIMHLVKAWGNPYRKDQSQWLSPWALYCGEINQEFPAPVLKTMLDWLACRTNLKEPLLDFASLHPGEQTRAVCPLTHPLPEGWKIRGSLAPVTKEQWLAKEPPHYQETVCETQGLSAEIRVRYDSSAVLIKTVFELLDENGKIRDYTETGVVCWQPETLPAPKVSPNGTYFDIERQGVKEKSRWISGTNWQDRYLFGFSFHNPNPSRIAGDALDMAETGLLFVRPHFFMPGWFRAVPGQVYEDGFSQLYEDFETGPLLSEKHMRALEAHIMLFCSAGLVFMPSVYTNLGSNMGSPSHWMGTSRLFVVPELIENQKKFARQIMERFGSIQGISWDLDNEPNEGIDLAGKWLSEHKKIWGKTGQMVGVGLFLQHNNMLLGESADWHSQHGKPLDIFHTGKPFVLQEAHYPVPCSRSGEQELEYHLNNGIALTLMWGGGGFMPWNWNMSHMNWRYRGGWVDFWDLHLGICVHADGTPRTGRRILKNWTAFLDGVEFDQSGNEQVVFVYPKICLPGKGSFEYLDLLYQKKIKFCAVNDEDLASFDLSGTKLLIFPLYGLGFRESSWEKANQFVQNGGVVWAHNDNLSVDEQGNIVKSRSIPEKTQMERKGNGYFYWCLGWNIDKDKNSDFDPDMVVLGSVLDQMELSHYIENERPVKNGVMRFTHYLDENAVMLTHEWNSKNAVPEKNTVSQIQILDHAGKLKRFWTNGECCADLGAMRLEGTGEFFVIKRNSGEYLVSAQNLTITGEIEGLKISLVELKSSEKYGKLDYSVDCHTESGQMKIRLKGWEKAHWLLLEK